MISVDRQVRETTREQTSGAITRGPRCPRTQQWLPEATSSHEHELSPPQRAICETHDPTPQAFKDTGSPPGSEGPLVHSSRDS